MTTQTEQHTFATDLEICYEVLLFLASRMAKVAPGDALTFISADPDAAAKVEEWCAYRGFVLEEATVIDAGHTRLVIRKPIDESAG